MKILFVHGIGEIGGAEQELLTIATELVAQGDRPVIWCPEATPLVQALAARGVETRAGRFVPWRKWHGLFGRSAAVRALNASLIAEEPAIVHVNDIWWVPQTRRAAEGLAVHLVAHVRQEIEPPKVSRYELDQVNLVLAVSRQIQRSLEEGGVQRNRILTLHSGMDLNRIPRDLDGAKVRRSLGLSEDDFVLGTVANLFPRKGYDVMIEAMPAILAEAAQAQYVIIGSGNRAYEAQLRAQVERLGLGRHVRFLGFHQDVYPLLAALDLYVHPALMEGFGIAVIEAMACRNPVLATSVGGIPEVVEDGRTGLLVPPGDPDALARGVLTFHRDPALRRESGKRGRQRVEDCFSLGVMMENLNRAYQDLRGCPSIV